MNLILAATHGGAVDQLSHAPWWQQLVGAALLGGGAYALNKRGGDGLAAELATFILALGALILVYHGVFGDA